MFVAGMARKAAAMHPRVMTSRHSVLGPRFPLIATLCVLHASCGAEQAGMGDSATVLAGETPADVAAPADPETPDDEHEASTDLDGQGEVPGGGLLTAGVWDDNQNFQFFLDYRSQRADEVQSRLLDITAAEHELAHAASEQGSRKQSLDVAFMIDTTGSMGDELSYLQAEFKQISAAITAEYPDALQRWSLVVYRDDGDAYVAEAHRFTQDVNLFQHQLEQQAADGGGDFPEAPDAAFQKLNDLAWTSDSGTAKLAFWVADAPHHTKNAGRLSSALRATRELGVHVYPIASSGIDDDAELTMRSAAQFTGGRYLFLTDDSGVGGEHKPADVPCYYVTHLDDAMLRMIEIEMSGQYVAPTEAQVIRSVGEPVEGACTLDVPNAANADREVFAF